MVILFIDVVRPQYLIKRDQIVGTRLPGSDQCLFRRKHLALRLQHVQVCVAAMLVTERGQPQAVQCRRDQRLIGGDLLVDRAASRQRVGNLAKCGLHRLFVGCDLHNLLGFRVVELCL
jgi:hypothetical protein